MPEKSHPPKPQVASGKGGGRVSVCVLHGIWQLQITLTATARCDLGLLLCNYFGATTLREIFQCCLPAACCLLHDECCMPLLPACCLPAAHHCYMIATTACMVATGASARADVPGPQLGPVSAALGRGRALRRGEPCASGGQRCSSQPARVCGVWEGCVSG